MHEVRLDVSIGDSSLSLQIELPAQIIRPLDLLHVRHEFDDALIAATVEQLESKISCRAGCSACCRQMIPISEIEAHYLLELIAVMPEERKQRVTMRSP